MKTTVKCHNGIIFDVELCSLGGGLVEASVFEVIRPHRKHFGRRHFFSTYSATLFIADHPTPEAMVRYMVAKALQQKEFEKNNKSFFEKTLDLPREMCYNTDTINERK